MTDQEQQKAPTAPEALQFLDGILAGVAGSRKDHIAIQGALGVVGAALAKCEACPAPKSDAPADDSALDIKPEDTPGS